MTKFKKKKKRQAPTFNDVLALAGSTPTATINNLVVKFPELPQETITSWTNQLLSKEMAAKLPHWAVNLSFVAWVLWSRSDYLGVKNNPYDLLRHELSKGGKYV